MYEYFRSEASSFCKFQLILFYFFLINKTLNYIEFKSKGTEIKRSFDNNVKSYIQNVSINFARKREKECFIWIK